MKFKIICQKVYKYLFKLSFILVTIFLITFITPSKYNDIFNYLPSDIFILSLIYLLPLFIILSLICFIFVKIRIYINKWDNKN